MTCVYVGRRVILFCCWRRVAEIVQLCMYCCRWNYVRGCSESYREDRLSRMLRSLSILQKDYTYDEYALNTRTYSVPVLRVLYCCSMPYAICSSHGDKHTSIVQCVKSILIAFTNACVYALGRYPLSTCYAIQYEKRPVECSQEGVDVNVGILSKARPPHLEPQSRSLPRRRICFCTKSRRLFSGVDNATRSDRSSWPEAQPRCRKLCQGLAGTFITTGCLPSHHSTVP